MIDRKQLKALCAAASLGPWISNAVAPGDDQDEDPMVYREIPQAGEKAISVLFMADWATVDDAAFVASCREAVPELIRQLELRENGPKCWTCGDMGHVSRIDGEYLGVCNDCNVYELSCVKHELAQAKQVIAEHGEPVSVNTIERREKWLKNITDAIKFGLPNYLRERLQNTEKQIRASMRYGGTKRLRDELDRLTAEVERVKALNHSQFGDAIRRNAEIERLTKAVGSQTVRRFVGDSDQRNIDELVAAGIQVDKELIARLRAERDLLKAEVSARQRQAEVMTDKYASELNEANELRKDAERYRLLRPRLLSAINDFKDNGQPMTGLAFAIPGGPFVSLDESLDTIRKELQR